MFSFLSALEILIDSMGNRNSLGVQVKHLLDAEAMLGTEESMQISVPGFAYFWVRPKAFLGSLHF